LVETYRCEWTEVVRDPAKRARFRHFANARENDDAIEIVSERGQPRPADWDKAAPPEPRVRLPVLQMEWVSVGSASDFPRDGGRAIKYGDSQIAVFNFESRGKWYATQNKCPHMQDMVLARGLIGDQTGVPKVACPLHKKTFSLEDGHCLSGEGYEVATFEVKVQDGQVYVHLPPAHEIVRYLNPKRKCAEVAAKPRAMLVPGGA